MTKHKKTDRQIAESCRGMPCRGTLWQYHMCEGDWHNVWPTIDRHGLITGEVIESPNGHLSVDDCAGVMISVHEARQGGWEIDISEGRARPAATRPGEA